MAFDSRPRLLLFFALLAPVVRRDLPLGEALRQLADEDGLGPRTLEGMAADVEEGHSLSEAMARQPRVFPAPLSALIASGEQAGNLRSAVEQCSAVTRHGLRSSRHLQAALVYPAICLALLLGFMAVQALHSPLAVPSGVARGVLGTYSNLYSGMELPVVTRMALTMYDIGQTIGNLLLWNPVARVALLLLVGLAAWALWLVFKSPRRTPRRDRMLLNSPLVGRLYRLAAASRFTRALGSLLARGVPVDSAVEAALPAAGNRWVERALGERLEAVRDGESLSAALDLPGVFPPSFAWRLSVGVRRGDLGGSLLEAAAHYERELELASLRLARLAEPAALIVVGLLALLVVGFFMTPFVIVAPLIDML